MSFTREVRSEYQDARSASERAFEKKVHQSFQQQWYIQPDRIERMQAHPEVKEMRQLAVHNQNFTRVMMRVHPFQEHIATGKTIHGWWYIFVHGPPWVKHIKFAKLLQSIK